MEPKSDVYRVKMASLQRRTKEAALRAVKLCSGLGPRPEAHVIRGQLLRSSMSSAANYRAACRARSRKEFIAKLGVVIAELDESAFWIEFATDAKLVGAPRVESLVKELNELLAILNASRSTAIRRLKPVHSSNR
jgi:four helix bundle protein